MKKDGAKMNDVNSEIIWTLFEIVRCKALGEYQKIEGLYGDLNGLYDKRDGEIDGKSFRMD
jgi:hypothetical protein